MDAAQIIAICDAELKTGLPGEQLTGFCRGGSVFAAVDEQAMHAWWSHRRLLWVLHMDSS